MTTPDSRKRQSQPATDISGSMRVNPISVDISLNVNSNSSNTRSIRKGQLEARWIIENDKLICKWVIV